MKFLTVLFLALIVTGCTDYYRKMVDWAGTIPVGTSIDSVKKHQPDYMVVDWNNPYKVDSEILYEITSVKYNHELKANENRLEFVNGKYKGFFFRGY